MLTRTFASKVIAASFALVGSVFPLFAQNPITTERYDQARTGANLNETQLTTSSVSASTFGKLWTYAVDGSVYAQPLYVPNLPIPGKGTHNVLYIETMNDVVYAFDADSNSILWSVDYRNPAAGVTPVPIVDIVQSNALNIVGNVGIESTPYIDLPSNTMYLVVRTKENGTYPQRLHAIDITNGAEKLGGPALIQGSVLGTGNASIGGVLTFDPKIHNQRSSLALANGQIFIAWASHEDLNPYHGWVMSYNASTLAQTGIFCSSPDGFMDGIWMAGRAPVVDSSNNVYYMVGNGDWNGTRNFGESMLKFASTPGMPLLDWFTPDSWNSLNAGDVDYGSSGPMLIPGTDLIIGGGKSSIFYLMHIGSLGHEQTGNGQIVETLPVNSSEIKGGPVYYNRTSGSGPWLYVWANDDYLKAYHFNGTTFDTTPVSKTTFQATPGSSGGVLTLSANGSTPGTGIIWSSMPLNQDADHGVHEGVLRALNADDLTKELWNSTLNLTRDDVGLWPKYSAPTVANGRVYLSSFSGYVSVFGLLPTTPDFSITTSPTSKSLNSGGSATFAINTNALNGFTGNVSLSVSGLPSGATASFSNTTIPATGSSNLTISTSAGIAAGNYAFTITGASGALTHTTSATILVTNITPGSGTISIDFVGRDVVMAPAEIAGVVPKSNWNAAQGAVGANQTLVDETGTATGATVGWSSSGVWSLPITDLPGDFRMMDGYLDTLGQNTTVTIAGLAANPAGYDIYVYADGDNGGARTGSYQISGTGITPQSVNLTDPSNINFSGTYTQANNSNGNYLHFLVNATAFTLTAIPSTASDGVMRAPVNGIQIVPHAPPPDFTFSVTPSSQTVAAGNSTTFTVSVAGSNGFNGTVALSASGLPSGASASFVPPSIASSGTSTLSVATASATVAGSSGLTITGSSGVLAHMASVTLVVNGQSAGATPTFAPPAGTYSSAQNVSITSTTGGSTIYYTTDGSNPTTNSTKYTAPVSVAATETLHAIALANGFAQSAVGSAAYTIQNGGGSTLLVGSNAITSVADDNSAGSAEAFHFVATASGTVATLTAYVDAGNSAKTLSIGLYTDAGGHPGALLTQGSTVSVTSSAWATVPVGPANVAAGTAYWIAVLGTGGTLKFRDGTQSGCNSESSSQSTLTVLPASWSTGTVYPASCPLSAYASGTGGTPQAATPTFSPGAGTYSTTTPVAISDATNGATIYYTTDGSNPTTSSTKYVSAVSISNSETLRAIAVVSGYSNSAIGSAAYVIAPPAAAPTFNPAAGTYSIAQSVTLSSTTTGASIYYTTNGSAPTTSSTKYSAAFSVATTETVKAIATASGFSNSAVSSATYTIQTVGPTILIGTTSVTSVADNNDAGVAEAFPVTATASGTLSTISSYVDSGNAASQLVIGIYSDNGGHPGTLLTQGTSGSLTGKAWATVTVSPPTLTAGVHYWIALMGTGGQLNFRDGNTAGCNSETHSQVGLKTLPAAWSTGTIWPDSCPLSAYGSH